MRRSRFADCAGDYDGIDDDAEDDDDGDNGIRNVHIMKTIRKRKRIMKRKRRRT